MLALEDDKTIALSRKHCSPIASKTIQRTSHNRWPHFLAMALLLFL